MALTFGIGIYLQVDSETPKQSKSPVAMARNGTEEEKHISTRKLGSCCSMTGLFPQEKIKNRERLTYRERKEFVDLLWIVKGIRLFNCDENGQNYFKELGVLTGL
ncbi:MAG: hypothetical protein IPL26_11565 [Leptospiraceae bacterium]|nr:hypothetical protein [Leptospiraceae bacterium]